MDFNPDFNPMNFTMAAPLLALAAGTLVIPLLDLLLPTRQSRPLWFLFAVLSVLLAGWYLTPLWGQELAGFGGALVVDSFALAFSVILLAATLLAILLSLGRREADASGYLALILWAAMGMIIIASAGDLMTIFVGLELLSLSLYVAVAFDPKRPQAREAALKYFVLGSVASAFILFGFALIYGVIGTTSLAAIGQYWSEMSTPMIIAAQDAFPLFYKAGLALAVVGFAFKLALVPFHAWAPDVYEGAPSAVTAFMSVGTKAAAFAAMARFLVAATPGVFADAVLLPLSLLAAVSMLLGAMVGIWQADLKRLMAYSGIAHAGYLIMAIPGLGSEGLSAAAFYMMAYMFTGMGIFAIIVLLEHEGEEGSKLSALTGLFYRRPVLGVAMATLMFALAGLPPTGGFIGKFLLARAAVGAGAWILLGGLVLSTGISAYVYLRVIGTLFKQPAEQGRAPKAIMAGGQEEEGLSPAAVRYGAVAVLAIAIVGILWLGILPGAVIDFLQVLVPQV